MLQPIQYGEISFLVAESSFANTIHYTRVKKKGFCFTVGDFIGAFLSTDQAPKSSAIKCLIKVYFGQRCEVQWSLDAYLGKSSTSLWYLKTRPSWWWLHPQMNHTDPLSMNLYQKAQIGAALHVCWTDTLVSMTPQNKSTLCISMSHADYTPVST